MNWKPWQWFHHDTLVDQAVKDEEELLTSIKDVAPSTYPRFTYLVSWKYLPEPRRVLKSNALHFEKQLTQREIRDVVTALNGRDVQIRCTAMKSVTGQPARVALSTFGIQKRAS